MPKQKDDSRFPDCGHLKVIIRNGDPDDWEWGCTKYRVYLRVGKRKIAQCDRCKKGLKTLYDKLKPCPHCGGRATFKDGRERGWSKPWKVVCPACSATGGPGGTRKEAAKNWNRRTQ